MKVKFAACSFRIPSRTLSRPKKFCFFFYQKFQGRNFREVVIFFSFTEAPLPDPSPTPPNTPKRTRKGPERDPTEPNRAKWTRTEPKWTEIKPCRVGQPGRFVGMGGGGVVREKEIVASQIYRMRPGKGKDGIAPSHCAEFRRTLVSQYQRSL